jgi:hypothetical protein
MEIVAFAAVYGLVVGVQESRMGIRIDDAMTNQVAFLYIGQMLREKLTPWFWKVNYHTRI